MTTNYVGEGKVINYVAGATIAAAAVVVTGDTVGIALVDMVSGETGAVAIDGVFTVTKAAGAAWVQGDVLAWDASAAAFTSALGVAAAGDVEACGIAAVAAASGALVGQVKLTPGTGTVT